MWANSVMSSSAHSGVNSGLSSESSKKVRKKSKGKHMKRNYEGLWGRVRKEIEEGKKEIWRNQVFWRRWKNKTKSHDLDEIWFDLSFCEARKKHFDNFLDTVTLIIVKECMNVRRKHICHWFTNCKKADWKVRNFFSSVYDFF